MSGCRETGTFLNPTQQLTCIDALSMRTGTFSKKSPGVVGHAGEEWYAPQRRPRPSPATILAASVSRPPQPPHQKASGRPRPYQRPWRPASTTRSSQRPFGQASTILSPVCTPPDPMPQA